MKQIKVCLIAIFVFIILPLTEIFAQRTTYDVWVQTGTKKDAGTDSDITIKFIFNLGGSQFETSDLPLDHDNNFGPYDNLFENGHLDKFHCIVDTDYGPVPEIIITSDNSRRKSGWYLSYIKVFYQPDSKIPDPRFQIDPDNSERNVTIFTLNDWIESSRQLSRNLKADDYSQIGKIISPTLVSPGVSRAVLRASHCQVTSNFSTQNTSASYEYTFISTDQLQFSKTESEMSSWEFTASTEFKLDFMGEGGKNSLSLKHAVQDTCTNTQNQTHSTSNQIKIPVSYIVEPNQVLAAQNDNFDVEVEGIVKYFDYSNIGNGHTYTLAYPDQPYINTTSVAFTVSNKTENGRRVQYLTPVNPDAVITQLIIDTLEGSPYFFKFQNLPAIIPSLLPGSLYKIDLDPVTGKRIFTPVVKSVLKTHLNVFLYRNPVPCIKGTSCFNLINSFIPKVVTQMKSKTKAMITIKSYGPGNKNIPNQLKKILDSKSNISLPFMVIGITVLEGETKIRKYLEQALWEDLIAK